MHAHLRQGSHVAYSVRMTTNLANVPEGTRVRNAHASEVMGTVMHTCIPPGSTSPANLGKFTFVANVDLAGKVSSVEVSPITKVSRCFAKLFGAATLPAPPASNNIGKFFPIADVMSVGP